MENKDIYCVCVCAVVRGFVSWPATHTHTLCTGENNCNTGHVSH